MGRWGPLALLCVGSLLVGFSLIELALAGASRMGLLDLDREPTLRETWAALGLRPDPDLGFMRAPHFQGELGGVRFRTNSLGLRGPEIPARKPPGTWRILALGDSTVFGFGVAFEETFGERLEALLAERWSDRRIEVVNAGVEGFSVFHVLRYLEREGIGLEPDLLVVETNFNDRRYVPSPDFEDGDAFAGWFYRRVRLREVLLQSHLYRALRRLIPERFLLRSGAFDYETIGLEDLHCRVCPDRYRQLLGRLIAFAHERCLPVLLFALPDSPSSLLEYRRAGRLAQEGDPGGALEALERFWFDAPVLRVIAALRINEIVARHGGRDPIREVPVWPHWRGIDGGLPVLLGDAYLAILEEAGRIPGVATVGIDPRSAEAEELYLDYIHLSAAGHARAAEALAAAIAGPGPPRVPGCDGGVGP